MTTGDYLDTHFRDPKLRALLALQGVITDSRQHTAPSAATPLIVHHYRHGAWFPVGGSEALAEAAREGRSRPTAAPAGSTTRSPRLSSRTVVRSVCGRTSRWVAAVGSEHHWWSPMRAHDIRLASRRMVPLTACERRSPRPEPSMTAH